MKFEKGRFFAIPFVQILVVAAMFLSPIFLPPCSLSQATATEYVDGTSMLHKVLEDANSWNDYSCTTEMYNYKPHSTTITHSKLFYKKGPRVRIEIQGGFRHGTVLLRTADGKFSGRAGFWLGGIPLKFDPDSRQLQTPGGYNALKADFPEMFTEMKEFVAKGYLCKVSAEPVEESKLGKKTLILELVDPEKSPTERVYLSTDEEHYPLRWDTIRENKLKSSIYFRNMKVNSGLPDSLFHL